MAKTMDDFLNGVSKLIDDVVDHELIMRNVTPQGGPVHNKRRQLAKILYDEYIQNIAPAIVPQNLSNDLCLTSHFINICQVDLISPDPNLREKAILTLKHFQYKISRITCFAPADMANCQRFETETLLRIILNGQNSPSTPNVNANAGVQNNQQVQQNAHASNSIPNVPPAQASTPINTNANAQRNLNAQFDLLNLGSLQSDSNSQHENTTRIHLPKLYKWGIKFSNESKSLGVFEFIQKVEAKAKAYEVSHESLFQSACELFDGFAAKWFLSQTFINWNEIKEKLISDFVQVDYLENLLDTIRQRKQAYNEEIVHFFTVFEDDCSRLPVQLTVDEKLNILKKNILQKYRPYVALSKFNSVDDMKHALKVLEMSMSQNNSTDNSRYVRFNSNDRGARNNEQRSGNNSNDSSRSRFDKFQAKTQNEHTRNDRSSSNTSQRSGDANASRSNFDRNKRPQTPNYRFDSSERKRDGNSVEHRSGSRNSNRSQSREKN